MGVRVHILRGSLTVRIGHYTRWRAKRGGVKLLNVGPEWAALNGGGKLNGAGKTSEGLISESVTLM